MEEKVTFEFDLTSEEMSVEKDAKIFEAGEYPDKEIAVTEADLDSIIGNFAEVPVKVEHTDSPLDPLGTVKRVWREGRELFARLAFPQDLATFLERRGVKKLSIGLYKDPLRLAEVSLVLSPRVASAAMFAEQSANPQPGEEVIANMTDADKDVQIRELQFALRAKDVDSKLAEMKAQGKIVPASEAYAREILMQGDGKITFGEDETTIAELFESFLATQPKVISFSELAPAVETEPGTPLSPEEQELLTKLGITREQYARYAS